jgi:hypothetical protein
MRRHITIKECINPDHHAVTVVLGAGVVADEVIIAKTPQKPKAWRNPKVQDSHQGIRLRRQQKRDGSIVLYS